LIGNFKLSENNKDQFGQGLHFSISKYSNQLPGKLNITSHSFRNITQLWKDSKDIEFVKQTVGHRKLDTTSAYVN
jgi:site-specific recombinase XerD